MCVCVCKYKLLCMPRKYCMHVCVCICAHVLAIKLYKIYILSVCYAHADDDDKWVSSIVPLLDIYGWCSGGGVVACRKYYMFETQNIGILLGENSREYATK